ncbi:hypothetical protein MettiDRAFT_1281 [Methanolobus tindarius DSM 2278]|jgi:hypothetical protein|uniref:Uncharacterized protein n=1 Tax=Methanolobus tindarius DSM 2278 TaxID=1090322 RepID=W9DQX4_METTI|nr:hypothetical protein [Methanolobus tindarius]ETA67845.1 hypothetical protein MettiDRAFT_1281 [Methanolobus tindarius DSM 2278]
MQEKRYPKGHFVAAGMLIGLPLGIPIGMVLGIFAIGPAIGIVLGLGVGWYLEKKYNPEPLPLAPEDEDQRNKILLVLSCVFLLGIAAFIALLLMTN